MTEEGRKYFKQEFDMVRYRVRLHMGKPLPFESGNPMTAKEGIAFLHQTKRFIARYYDPEWKEYERLKKKFRV